MIKHKDVIRLLEKSRERKKAGIYIAEGPKMVYEAAELGLVVKAFMSESFFEGIKVPERPVPIKAYEEKLKSEGGFDLLAGCEYEVLDDKRFKELSGTVTPQGIIAAVKMNRQIVEEILTGAAHKYGNNQPVSGNKTGSGPKKISRFLIIENIQDPGNLGTIVRTAEAAGFDGIFMNKGTVDIYNPKVVRSTMGAIFRVPFAYCDETHDIIDICRKNGILIYGAALSGKDIREISYADRCAFVIGNESKGISEKTLALCDEIIKIPMAGRVESLNASVAAGLLMYFSNLSFL